MGGRKEGGKRRNGGKIARKEGRRNWGRMKRNNCEQCEGRK